MEIVKIELDYEEFVEARGALLRTIDVYKKYWENAIKAKDESAMEYYSERKISLEIILEKIDEQYEEICKKIDDLPF